MTNSIGEFEFLTLAGIPDRFKQECLVLSRPGVEGVAVWLTSERGVKFTLRSAVDAENLEAAQSLFQQYAATIGGDPVILYWNDIIESKSVVVLDVRPASIRAILGGVGGLNSPSQGWCECDWDLIHVQTEANP